MDGKIRWKGLLVPGSAGASRGVFEFVEAAAAAMVLRRAGLVDMRGVHAVRHRCGGERGHSVDERGGQDVPNW